MKDDLAKKILRETMDLWDSNELTAELKDIQIMSDLKYDDYQQYTHGMRYIESLALWLRQFDKEDKIKAYKFVKDNLLYVSQQEMLQLVESAFQLKIKPHLIKTTKNTIIREHIDISESKKIYDLILRKSLFLGLSDGAHIDYFRRQNPELSNEQVFVHYDFSNEKADDMKKELKKDLECYDVNIDLKKDDFLNYYLLDDFSASGTSYIRIENGEWHGKIPKFVNHIREQYCVKSATVNLVLYLATDKASNYISNKASEFLKDTAIDFNVEVLQYVYPLECNEEQLNLLSQNYNSNLNKYGEEQSYVDKHYKKGNGKKPYLGFADCSLPLVLYHNTPNNSFPILWYGWIENQIALFPRVTRHREQ